MTKKETAWVEGSPICECGHKAIFHNGHCCSFCMVPGCECDNGSYVSFKDRIELENFEKQITLIKD